MAKKESGFLIDETGWRGNLNTVQKLEWSERKLYYLLLFGLAIRLVLAWLPFDKLIYLTSDDAYYYFSIAKNIVNRGMLSADGITLTNGFHPLWLFVITPIFIFFQASPWVCIHLVLTLSAFFDSAAAFFIFKSLEALNKSEVGFWAAAFYLVNPYGLLHTMNGLETALNNFFLALLVYLSLKATPEWLKKGWFLLGTVSGLALLSRTDNIFFVAALFAYLHWRDRRLAEIGKTLLPAIGLVLPWMVYNFITFGTVLQSSGSAYPFHYHQLYLNEHKTFFSSALITYLAKLTFYEFALNAYHYGNWVLSLALAGYLLFQFKKRRKDFHPFLWMLVGAFLYVAFHVLMRWSVRPWYPQAVFILTLPAVALGLENLRRPVLWAVAIFALFFSARNVWSTPFRMADRSVLMLDVVYNRIPSGDRVGVFNSGYLQYFTDQKVVNLDGLVNNEILPYYGEKKGLEYLRQKNIRWLLDTPSYLAGVFGLYFGTGAESSLAVREIFPSPRYPTALVSLVEVLPEGSAAPADRVMPIWYDKTLRRWPPVPLFERMMQKKPGTSGNP